MWHAALRESDHAVLFNSPAWEMDELTQGQVEHTLSMCNV
jgi:hypothetical protein